MIVNVSYRWKKNIQFMSRELAVNPQNKPVKFAKRLFPFIAYPLLGLVVFYLYALNDLGYLAKNYVSLLELQLGVILIYLVTKKLRK